MKLVYRFGIAFLVVVLVAGSVLAVTFDAHRTDVADDTDAAVADRAALSASILDNRIEEQRRAVDVVARNPDLASHGTERQHRALEEFVDATAFDGATVVDANGTVRSYVTTNETIDSAAVVGTELGDRTYVRNALDGERYVSDPLTARSGNTIITISAPLVEAGEIVGSVNAAYYLDETGLFQAVDDRSDDRNAITVETETETLYTTADRFDETVAHSADLETVDWTVTAHRDKAAVDRRTNRLVLFQAVSGVALLGAITAFGGWVYRSKIRRIGTLADRVHALERREYDAGGSLGGATEWRRIDDALDRLTNALARREQMLLVLNRILRHNLRNSLNVVAGRAADLETRLDGDERASAREIRAVTDDLLELADRARTTEALLDPVGEERPRTDLAALVRERVERFANREDGDGNEALDVSVTAPDGAVAACGAEVSVAIDELLANVTDHAGPSPTVAVTVERDDDWVRVRFDDDGPGIPDDEAAVITGNRAISQVTHTGGIGLWLVDWIVSRDGGRLLIPPSTGGGSADGSPANGPSTDGSAADDGGVDHGNGDSNDGATVVLEFPSAPESEAESAEPGADFDRDD